MKTKTAPKGTKKPPRGNPAAMKDPVVVDGIGTMEREQAEKLYPTLPRRSTKLYKTNEQVTSHAVGKGVMYKDDHEKYGKLIKVTPSGMAVIKVWDADAGEHTTVTRSSSRVFLDETAILAEVSSKMMMAVARKALSRAKESHARGDEITAAKKAKQGARVTTKALVARNQVGEGWGAETQAAEHDQLTNDWNSMYEKHRSNASMTSWLKYFQKNRWKPSYAEREAERRIADGSTVAESFGQFIKDYETERSS